MKFKVPTKVTLAANSALFKLQKKSPEILVVAGVTGTVVSAVLACRATLKVNAILDETKESVEKIHSVLANEKHKDEYSEEDAKHDLTIVYVQTGVKLVKLYAPSVILGALSITSILASNNILRKRNVALAAAYTTIDKSFKEYRNRVVERFGEAVDKELKYNIEAEKVVETKVNEKTGKTKEVETEVPVSGIDGYSEYARFFDETCPDWTKDAEYNHMFLHAQQNYANDLLRTRGHLFLNEVYDMLGMERTKAGQVVGWIYKPEADDKDNYVDFGIYDVHRRGSRRFVNGIERSILLDFNVDTNLMNEMF